MHQVEIDGRRKQVPADWNELTRPLLLQLVPALYSPADSPTQLRLRVLRVLLQVSWNLLLECTDVQLAQILWLADPFVDEVRLTTQLIPTLQAPGRARWWAPRENFRNLRMLEFMFADAYFVAFSQDLRRTDYLDQLVGVLYRPERQPYRPKAPNYAGDRREEFNPVHVAKRAAGLKNQLLPEKLAVYTWYRGCREQLVQEFPQVFRAPDEEAPDPQQGGWAKVARDLAGGIFGNLQQTEYQLVRDILAKLQDDAQEAERLRQQAKSTTP